MEIFHCYLSGAFGGAPRLMCKNQLPLTKDVGLHVLALEMGGLGRTEAILAATEEVKSIYLEATIPTIDPRSIQRKIKRLFQLKGGHENDQTVDKRTGKQRFQGKHSKKSGVVGKGNKTGKLYGKPPPTQNYLKTS